MTGQGSADLRSSIRQTAISWDFFLDMPAEKDAFCQVARLRKINRKEILFHEGDIANSVYYLLEGELIVTRISSSGREVVLYIHKKGALIGTLASLLNLPRNSSGQALTAGAVLEVQNSDFKSLVLKYPRMTDRILLQLYGTVDFVTAQHLSAFSDNAEIRLKKLLARLFSEELLKLRDDSAPDSISLSITQDQLACAIGVSREMVSRMLKRMQADGLINKSAHRIAFLNPGHFLTFLEIPSSRPQF